MDVEKLGNKSDDDDDENLEELSPDKGSIKETVMRALRFWKIWVIGIIAGVLAVHAYMNPNTAISSFFFEAAFAGIALLAFGVGLKKVEEGEEERMRI